MGESRSEFRKQLDERSGDPAGRRWLYVPYDQLHDGIGPLSREDPAELGIVLVENPDKAARRPYHRRKLALVLANLRHFALEQAARGVAVRHVAGRGTGRSTYGDFLEPVARELGPLRVMEPAERELREELRPLVESGALEVVPHEGWLTTGEQFADAGPADGPWRMDAFYRRVRRDTGILMENGSPAGGKFSHDADNRKPWKGDPPAPEPPTFETDAVTDEVRELLDEHFADHPGEVDWDRLPATAEHAEEHWRWALRECMESFGPYEDAMSTKSTGLFHTRISALVNLHRLLPGRVVDDVVAADIPLGSREGFVRQVLGWREFVRHVHRVTDGFRNVDTGRAPLRYLGGDTPLPDAYWGTPTGLHCLDTVVADVWREGYSHHITRLMVLSNLATLLDYDPRELSDWFRVAYEDAYDWVVEPNVLGMGTFAVGDLMTTKPYVSGAAYIDRMSDYCGDCRFHPKKTCPVTPLYWRFLATKEDVLANTPRTKPMLRGLGRRSDEKRHADTQAYRVVRRALKEGRELEPDEEKGWPAVRS